MGSTASRSAAQAATQVERDRWVPFSTAWHEALYGAGGFYRREAPADHFRTSSHVGSTLASALVTFASRNGLTELWDIGAGSGELLSAVHQRAPDLRLVGVDIRPRPAGLADAIEWRAQEPVGVEDALVVAVELLDDVVCTVVEADPQGCPRVVEVNVDDGSERLGPLPTEAESAWLRRWWPGLRVGERAEIGLSRESHWARIAQANPAAFLLAIDYGHLAARRPRGGSMSSYHRGRQVPLRLDGSCDVTAGVAFDSLEATVPGRLVRQRDALAELVPRPQPLSYDDARTDPAGYLRRLADGGERAELRNPAGLGDHVWLISDPARREGGSVASAG